MIQRSLIRLISLFSFISITTALLPSLTAIAQESDGCFLIDSQKRVIPLNGLCGNQLDSTGKSGRVFRARIKRHLNGIPVIDVRFGKYTFEMIVDTGASHTLITGEMANSMRVFPVGRAPLTIADGSQVAFLVGYVPSIAVAGAEIRDVPVAIATGMDIGLLGHDFFGSFDVTIKKDTVEFRPR